MENQDILIQENETKDVNTTTAGTIYNITFKKPYIFEGQTYDGIDLSNIENIATKDLLEVDKLYTKLGYVSPTAEMTLAYACIIASKITQKSLEFFNNLPGNEIMKVKTAVINFLYN
ncbi:phage tail assembly protein [Clostridium sp.]|uniref:phage tail assembly protein n=1 Tax=Clostridium sp. TaxID=1506 RepID=UPI00263445F4|nr:phage tail assembly protein [Clostridium sp.]